MRRIRYGVAASLDGYIADPDGGNDWILADPSLEFASLFAELDTALMGRRTCEQMLAQGSDGTLPGMRTFVQSRTLDPEDHPAVTVLGDDGEARIAALKAEPAKDIWLFGGGGLFRNLLGAGPVDTVEVALIPVLLGSPARGRPPLAGHGAGRQCRAPQGERPSLVHAADGPRRGVEAKKAGIAPRPWIG